MHYSEHLFDGATKSTKMTLGKCRKTTRRNRGVGIEIDRERVIGFDPNVLHLYTQTCVGSTFLRPFLLQAQASSHRFSIKSNWRDGAHAHFRPFRLNVCLFSVPSLSRPFPLAIFNFHLTRFGVFSKSCPCSFLVWLPAQIVVHNLCHSSLSALIFSCRWQNCFWGSS